MSIEAPHPETHERKSKVWLQRAVGLLGSAALSAVSILGIDAGITQALEVPHGPSVAILDQRITTTQNPVVTMRSEQADPMLVERCRESKFVVLVIDGTGLPTSFYTGNQINDIVNELEGCVMYVVKGTEYDEQALAQEIKGAIDTVTPKGEVKHVVVVGQSEGGIIAEDMATNPLLENADNLIFDKIIFLMTPVDMDDVKQTIFGIPATWLNAWPGELPKYGNLTVLINAINGQRLRGDLGDLQEWRFTRENAAKTDPNTMHADVERVRTGMRKFNPNIDIDYVATPEDETVDNSKAIQRLVDMMRQAGGTGVVSVHWLPASVKHDGCWQAENAPTCNEVALEPAIASTRQ
jgi:hypothetical protein